MILKTIRPTIAILALLLLAPLTARAQSEYVRDWSPFPIINALGDPIAVPFWGGINVPKPSLADFDGDGLVDLFIGDRFGKLAYFRNRGTNAVPDWRPVFDRLGGIDIASWHKLVDLDDDGDLDLLCDNRVNGAEYWENNQGTFTLIDSAYGTFVTGVFNTPDLVDIDRDGDLDFFFGGIGGTLVFYRNDGTRQAPSFSLTDSYYDSISAFPGGGGLARVGNENHGFSSIEFADIDADNDYDLFWGDINNINLYLFSNRGDSAVSDLQYETDSYLPGPGTFGFNHVRLADLDGDGDLDMLVGVVNGADIDNMWYMKNYGTPQTANFVLENTNLLDNFDIGSFSFPAIADLDNDSDLDILVGRSDGRLTYLKNTGSNSSPVLTVQTDFFGAIDVGTNASPELVDWDRDGDLDLLIGTGLGRVEYWRNDGSISSFQPTQVTSQLFGLKVDQYAIPRVADLDGDNRYELLLGEWDFNSSANVLLYTDTATSGEPKLTLVTNRLLKEELGRSMALPSLVDWDSDGVLDILLGNSNLGLQWFRNTTDGLTLPDSNSMVLQSDTLPGTDAGSHLVVATADLDGDGDRDLVIGEADGGLNYFVKTGSTCCLGFRGNVDGDPQDSVTLTDATALVNHLFITFAPLACPAEADLGGPISGELNLTDLTILINHLFITFEPLPPCD